MNSVVGAMGNTYTSLGSLFFQGRGVNTVLMRIVSEAIAKGHILDLYEGYWQDEKLHLLNGVNTKPVKVGVVTDENGVVHISDGYISGKRKVIDWNLVGAIASQNRIVWTNPRLAINLRLVQNNEMERKVSKTDALLYRNLKEFKDWLSVGRVFRVVDWVGKRNRRNFRLVVTSVTKTRGFNIDVYFGNRKVGSDFITFQPANCYEFKVGGIIKAFSPVNEDLLYVLEPLEV